MFGGCYMLLQIWTRCTLLFNNPVTIDNLILKLYISFIGLKVLAVCKRMRPYCFIKWDTKWFMWVTFTTIKINVHLKNIIKLSNKNNNLVNLPCWLMLIILFIFHPACPKWASPKPHSYVQVYLHSSSVQVTATSLVI